MKKVLLFSLTAICLLPQLHAQVTCNATSFDVDLSPSIDTTVSFQSTRNGNCCTGTNCIRFNLKLNPACSYVNFTVINPAPPGNSAYYQIDCGTPTSLGTPICIVGKTDVVITFCKPGNDNPIYTITAAGALKGSDDISVREGCTGSMNVSGLQTATINWTSVYPGAEGAYNSWLNCTSGCTSANVTPQTGAPAYVDYKVSGYRLCGPLVSDTIRVYTTPQIAVSISPDQPSVCAGGSSSVTLTAEASGGDAPYNFIWSNGQTGPSITVNAGNTYSVSVTDTRNCLPAIQSVLVKTIPLPATPVISTNSPVCEGSSLQLSVPSVVGAIYSWTGPNGFTSVLQNPVINNVTAADAGSYRVVVTVGQCSSLPAIANVVVNQVPAAPTIGSNSPVCEAGNLGLTASNIPGAVYNWSGPNGFNSIQQNPAINSVALVNAGSYLVTATVNGCTSSPSSVAVIINPLPPAPVLSANSPLCTGNSLSLNAEAIANASFSWTGPNGFTSSSQNPVLSNAGILSSGNYFVRATVNGCTGSSSSIAVVVNPIPAAPLLSSNQPVCEGSTLNLMASSIAGASYIWTGPNGFMSTSQNPSIASAATSASGIYSAYLSVNGCNSATTDIAAVVNPIPSKPVVNGTTTVCQGATLTLSTSAVGLTAYKWAGPNGFNAATSSISISNISTPNSGLYSLTATLNGCTSIAATTNVMVNNLPISPQVTTNSPLCSGTSLALTATNLAGATYAWIGPNGFTSSQQNPAINNVSSASAGDYYLSVVVNGCQSASPSSATVVVKQTPPPPSLSNNSPVCEGSALNLSANGMAGASYSWTGPNGFSSSLQNISLTSVTTLQSGTYSGSITVNGCTSPSASSTVQIDQQAKSNAGPDQSLCSTAASVNLTGLIAGGKGLGIWSTSGSGSFVNNNNLVTNYSPSAADKAAGSISLNLTSTNNGACMASTSSVLIHFTPAPSADAGPDQTICANDKGAVLDGRFTNAFGGMWSSSGMGVFQPSSTNPNAVYIPAAKDKTEGSVKLAWTTTGNGPCPAASDAVTISIKSPPSITTAGIQYVLENNSAILKPVVIGSPARYSWTPAVFLNNDTVPNPLCTPKSTVSYQLLVTDDFGCSSSAPLTVKLIRNPVIPNVFTPNGDGINDTWQIKNLSDYTECVVEIYNRYGQVVQHVTGYSKAWDGTSNGKPLPAATYYYIIDLKTGAKPLSGFVDIVR